MVKTVPLFLAAAWCSIIAPGVYATVIRVPGDASNIQGGIDLAILGDTVLVAPGTYVENISLKGKEITVTSEVGAEATIIDGSNPPHADSATVVYMAAGETPFTVLKGFTLRGGTGIWRADWEAYLGGGIYCHGSSPTITECIITQNEADDGGGIACEFGDPIIKGNLIEANTANDH